jgi:hypothetical protein
LRYSLVPESQDRWEKAQWGGESEAARRYSFVFRAPEKKARV